MRSKFCLTEAGERTVRLYEAWGKAREAEAWRARLATRSAAAGRVTADDHDPAGVSREGQPQVIDSNIIS